VAAQGYAGAGDTGVISAVRKLNPEAVKNETAAVTALDAGEVKLPKQTAEDIGGAIGLRIATPYIARGIRGIARGVRALGRQVTGATNAARVSSEVSKGETPSEIEEGKGGGEDENHEGEEESNNLGNDVETGLDGAVDGLS